MLCCRCGVTTDGVELNPDAFAPICPACFADLESPGKQRGTVQPQAKPAPPAKPKRTRKRKNP